MLFSPGEYIQRHESRSMLLRCDAVRIRVIWREEMAGLEQVRVAIRDLLDRKLNLLKKGSPSRRAGLLRQSFDSDRSIKKRSSSPIDLQLRKARS